MQPLVYIYLRKHHFLTSHPPYNPLKCFLLFLCILTFKQPSEYHNLFYFPLKYFRTVFWLQTYKNFDNCYFQVHYIDFWVYKFLHFLYDQIWSNNGELLNDSKKKVIEYYIIINHISYFHSQIYYFF